MKVDPNSPFYPSEFNASEPGIPIRLAIAAQIMAHLSVAPQRYDMTMQQDASWALDSADALIEAHNKGAA